MLVSGYASDLLRMFRIKTDWSINVTVCAECRFDVETKSFSLKDIHHFIDVQDLLNTHF